MTQKINKQLKLLLVAEYSHTFLQQFVDLPEVKDHFDCECVIQLGLTQQNLKEKATEADISLFADSYCLQPSGFVKRRSVGSHFLNFTDFILNQQGELWGRSVFTEVFRQVLLHSIQNQDFKGPVIFLGKSSYALPIIEVLAAFGFEDFVFLDCGPSPLDISHYNSRKTGLLGTHISSVDSAAFIQSQKEYSFCFVLQSEYDQQILDDMSYFHFLSPQSMVFDLVGQSNFLFKEVRALGVGVTDFSKVSQVWSQRLLFNLKESASKISSNP